MSWPTVKVADALVPVEVGPSNQVLASEVQPEGEYPVVDQGQAFIAGYTDDHGRVVRNGLPLVIFGDHTRTVKYVDFPFVLGADGTKVLKADPKRFDARFFYYALRAIPLPDRGYNRHYSLLKERQLPQPALSRQQEIATVLAAAERAVQAQARLVDMTLELRNALQDELIGRASRMRDWSHVPIASLGKIVTGTTPKTSVAEYYAPPEIPFIAPADLGTTRDVTAPAKQVSRAGLAVSRPLPARAVMCVCIGSSIGKVGMTVAEASATNQQINSIVCSQDHDPRFVYYLLSHMTRYWRGFATFGTVPILNKGTFSTIEVPTPKSREEQVRIADVLAEVDAKAELHMQRKAVAEELFDAVLTKLLGSNTDLRDKLTVPVVGGSG